MFIVERIEGNYVILECDGKILEIEKEKLPNVKENDILYLENDRFIKSIEKTNEVKKDIRDRFNKLK